MRNIHDVFSEISNEKAINKKVAILKEMNQMVVKQYYVVLMT